MTNEHFPLLFSTKELDSEFKNCEIIRINSKKFMLGRGLDNSVIIPYCSLSRKHCTIQLEDNGDWVLLDTSLYGIKVNGQSMQKGHKHVLSDNDILQLDVNEAFVYKFSTSDNTGELEYSSLAKRIKLSRGGPMVSTEEIHCLENRIKAAQDNRKKFKDMKEELEVSLEKKLFEVNNQFDKKISSLCGDDIAKKKAALETEKDLKLQEMRLEMEGKIKDLRETIAMHTATEEKLNEENTQLKEKLEAERKEFEMQLSKENELKRVLQEEMEAKLRHEQLEREKEKKILEENTKKEIELLKTSNEKEVKDLEEQMKLDQQAREELKKMHEELQKQVHSTTEEKNKSEKEFQEKLQQLQKAAEDDKIKIEELENTKTQNENNAEKNTNETEKTVFGELMESELQCTICAELMIISTTLNCAHSFCKFCIGQWRKKKNICPICRANIKTECRSLVLDSFIEKMIQNLSEEMQQRRQQALKDRHELVTQPAERDAAKPNRGRTFSGSSLSSYTNSITSDYLDSSAADRSSGFDWEFDHDIPDYEYDHESYLLSSRSESSTSDYDFTASAPEPERSSTNTVPANDATQQQVVEGTPGSYYGGYGSCYICGARGHWSPGCPFR